MAASSSFPGWGEPAEDDKVKLVVTIAILIVLQQLCVGLFNFTTVLLNKCFATP
jgi:hypothetical protein